MDGSHAYWDDIKCFDEDLESSFGCLGHQHASIVVLLDHQLPVHTDAHPGCSSLVESFQALSGMFLSRQL
jgi:hypothetical protein